MNKLFAMLAAVLFLVSAFSGCAKKNLLSPKDPVVLTMWHVYGEQADAPMNRMIEEFNATVGQEKGITVSVTNVVSTSKIGLQLVDALNGKPGLPEMPDLFSCHTTTAVMLGPENLVDWNEQFSKDELSGYVPEFIEDGTMGDRLAVFPVSKSTYALFINGAQFDRFAADTGVSYDSLATWEGFFEAAEKYYEWSNGGAFCALDYLIRHVELDMLSVAGHCDYTNEGWYDFDDPALKDSWMKFAIPLAQGHIIVSDLYANTQVMTGEALAGIGSTAAIIYYNDTVTYPDNTSEPMDLRVLPLPLSGTDAEYMPQTGVGFASYETTEQKAQAAAVFLRWFTEGQRNLDFVAETGYMPVSSMAFEVIDTYTFADPAHTRLYEAICSMRKTHTPVVRPDFDGFYDKVDQLYAALRDQQPLLRARSDAGEAALTLAEETWDIFRSVH